MTFEEVLFIVLILVVFSGLVGLVMINAAVAGFFLRNCLTLLKTWKQILQRYKGIK